VLGRFCRRWRSCRTRRGFRLGPRRFRLIRLCCGRTLGARGRLRRFGFRTARRRLRFSRCWSRPRWLRTIRRWLYRRRSFGTRRRLRRLGRLRPARCWCWPILFRTICLARIRRGLRRRSPSRLSRSNRPLIRSWLIRRLAHHRCGRLCRRRNLYRRKRCRRGRGP
jgi:hypothetical protein